MAPKTVKALIRQDMTMHEFMQTILEHATREHADTVEFDQQATVNDRPVTIQFRIAIVPRSLAPATRVLRTVVILALTLTAADVLV